MDVPRRAFVQQAAFGVLAAWSLSDAALDDAGEAAVAALTRVPPKPQALTPEQLRTLDAATARIIPSDDTPGAKEAGAVWFIDRLLARWAPEQKPAMSAILAGLDRTAAAQGASSYAALPAAAQDCLLYTSRRG